jgi:hypothetical protein
MQQLGAIPGGARVNLQRTVFARLYRRAPSVETLPWHREQPPALLEASTGSPIRSTDAIVGGAADRPTSYA